jgi:hypothetical protein
MLRRAIGLPAAAGRAASSRWRGFLTVSFDLEDGKHERAEFKLSVPWGSASASPSGDAIERAVSSEGCKVDTSRLTMNSMGKGGVIASSVLMTATNFDASKARSRRGRGRQMNLVDIHIWPQESRAAATLMRKNGTIIFTFISCRPINCLRCKIVPVFSSVIVHVVMLV